MYQKIKKEPRSIKTSRLEDGGGLEHLGHEGGNALLRRVPCCAKAGRKRGDRSERKVEKRGHTHTHTVV